MTKIVTSFAASFYEGPLDWFKFQRHSVCKNLDLKGNIMHVPFPSLIAEWGDQTVIFGKNTTHFYTWGHGNDPKITFLQVVKLN